MRLKTLLVILTLSGASELSAQFTAPKYSNEFLSLPVGARAQGMGGAQTASTGGAESGYWNPASLLNLEFDHNISLMHTEFFGGVSSYDFVAYASAIDSISAFGITAIRLGVDDIPDTRFLYDANGRINYDNINLFTAADMAFFFSYARKLDRIPGIEFGASVKVIYRKVGKFANAWGFGIDLGANYVKDKWRFSIVGRDLTGTFNAWSHSEDLLLDVYQTTGNSIPTNSVEVTLPQLVFGLSREFIAKDNFTLLGTVDLRSTFDGKRNTIIGSRLISIDPVVGIESGYKKKIHLRLGIGGLQNTEFGWKVSPHFGLGLNLSRFRLDYALSRLSGLSDGLFSHTFSLNLGINE